MTSAAECSAVLLLLPICVLRSAVRHPTAGLMLNNDVPIGWCQPPTRMRTHTRARARADIRRHIYADTHGLTQTHAPTRTKTHTYTHTHTHTNPFTLQGTTREYRVENQSSGSVRALRQGSPHRSGTAMDPR